MRTNKTIQLPLLEHVMKLWSYPSLEGIAVIGVQHLMESTLAMIQALLELGLDPTLFHLIGKCYSTNPEIEEELRDAGISVSKLSQAYDRNRSFDEQFQEYLSLFVSQALEKIDWDACHTLILLDDGGALIHHLEKIRQSEPNRFNRVKITAIEQTSSGYHRLKEMDLNFPVYNIARSYTKLTLETPYIIASSIARMAQKMDLIDYSDSGECALVLGHGVLGSAVISYLNRWHVPILAHEKDEDEYALAAKLAQSKLVIGTTGCVAINRSQHRFIKPGTTLVSLSSSDREFDAVHLRKGCDRFSGSCWDDLNCHGIHLIQSGFPVNFWGCRNNIPLESIQITLALLLAALLDSATEERQRSGFVSLPPGREGSIAGLFREIEANKQKKSFLSLRTNFKESDVDTIHETIAIGSCNC